MTQQAALSINIRTYTPADAQACQALYVDGLIGPALNPMDTAVDIDDIPRAYLHTPGNCFWVAQLPDGSLAGMLGIQQHEPQCAEIRRLRVRGDCRRRGVGSRLMETALRFCQNNGMLKVTLDTYMEREPAMRLFEKFHFKHARSKSLVGKELRYFYLDLYQRDKNQVSE